MNFQSRLLKVIPGGAHTYSRGFDQFPINAPQVLQKGKGVYVFDESNNKFLDYGMGLRSVNIGYSEPDIDEAAFRQIKNGNNLSPDEIFKRWWGIDEKTRARMVASLDEKWCVYWRPSLIKKD